MIVGESLTAWCSAGSSPGRGSDDPLAIFTGNDGTLAEVLGIVGFAAVLMWLYKRTQEISSVAPVKS